MRGAGDLGQLRSIPLVCGVSAVFATSRVGPRIARNDPFAPQLRGAARMTSRSFPGRRSAINSRRRRGCDGKRTGCNWPGNTLGVWPSAQMSKPTEGSIARFSALLDELTRDVSVVRASMFGMPGIKRRGGKAFCGLYGDDMIFKLEGEDHARALSLKGAHLFEPMAGRPMKAWIQVPPEHEAQYGDLARAAEASLGL